MLIQRLNEILVMEPNTSVEILCSLIVGEVSSDYEGPYAAITEINPTVHRISELASQLEMAEGSSDERLAMWNELKFLVAALEQDDR